MSIPSGAGTPSSRQPQNPQRSGQRSQTFPNVEQQYPPNRQRRRWLAGATAAATVLGLVFAYLQVAQSAHWFPFSPHIESFVGTLADPSGSERATGTPDERLDQIDRQAWRDQVIK